MRYIADFHIHSKYSRACSKNLDLDHLAAWAPMKGIRLLSTGDFTHPAWFKEISSKLVEDKPGIFVVNDETRRNAEKIYSDMVQTREYEQPYFILGSELSAIYTHGGKVRRVHLLVFLPSLECVKQFNEALIARGCNLNADGRPILGLSAKEILQIGLDISPDFVMIPAHAWTPWFAIFGSKSGYDSIEECFEELAAHIFAIETGLSSDPKMNWQLSRLDRISLISNSDAHSLDKLGREATIFEGELTSYRQLFDAMKKDSSKRTNSLALVETIEFFPEEGKYHNDGHAKCHFSCEPAETKKLKGICPVCRKPLTVGVLHRVSDLADREEVTSSHRIPYRSIVPLKEIIAQCVGVGVNSKKVSSLYEELINSVGDEFYILLDAQKNNFTQKHFADVVGAIMRMRDGDVQLAPGYDGVFGVITVSDGPTKKQASLM